MIRMRVDDMVPPLRLAGPVRTKEGQVLLGQGASLTNTYIERLKGFGIRHVWVRDERLSDLAMLEIYPMETCAKVAVRLIEILTALGADRTAMKKILVGGVFDRVVQDAMGNSHQPVPPPEEGLVENKLTGHSLRVCLLATALGPFLAYSREQLLNLSVGALVHDTGKAIPRPPRPAGAPEKDNHPSEGFDLVLRARHLSATVGVICLQHHEWWDGTGFPKGLTGEAIHPFARLVAVVDRYDNLVFGPNPVIPHVAMETLSEEAGTRLCPAMVALFRQWVAPYPPGTPLRLSDGGQAVVVAVEPGKLARPRVRITSDPECPDVNLAEHPEIQIEAVAWSGAVVDTVEAA